MARAVAGGADAWTAVGRPTPRRHRPHDAETAVKAAVDRFGAIDVLVNNAGNFYAGHFEELTPEQIDRQLATSLTGPMNVTRASSPSE